MSKTLVENRLSQVRKSRGVGASDLARRVNVSRQTIYAIEAGTYVPNTEVALHLARELEVSVDELFSLSSGSQQSPESLSAEVLSASAPAKGQPVRICQIGSRWVSVPVSATPYYMPEADGIIKRTSRANGRADLLVFAKDEAGDLALLTAHHYITGQDNAAATIPFMLAEEKKYQPVLSKFQAISRSARIPWRMCETASFSGGGKAGVSDTFAAALWALDYLFVLSTFGCAGVNMETGVNHLCLLYTSDAADE